MVAQFAEKVALVTGAANGIGRATALSFAREGAAVVVADIDVAGGEETVRQIRGFGGDAIFVRTDASQEQDVVACLEQVMTSYGRLDFAFNNAGIEGEVAFTADCTPENWDRVLRVNLTSVWLCMKHEIPLMLKAGKGAIVNCASVAGLVGFPGSPAYVASKHGIVGLTKTAALEYATQGIRVNAVCPGVIRTPMIDRFTAGNAAAVEAMTAMEPIGRLGEADEIAASVVWLCSDGASYVTGVALPVDGALTAR